MSVSDVVREYAAVTNELISDGEIDRLEALQSQGLVTGTDLLAIAEGHVRLEDWLTQHEALAVEIREIVAGRNAKDPLPESSLAAMDDPMRRDQVRQLLEEGRLDRHVIQPMLSERRTRELNETIEQRWVQRRRELDRSLGHER